LAKVLQPMLSGNEKNGGVTPQDCIPEIHLKEQGNRNPWTAGANTRKGGFHGEMNAHWLDHGRAVGERLGSVPQEKEEK